MAGAGHQSSTMNSLDPQLGSLELQDADDRPVKLGDLWRDGPAVLVWVRHYG